MNSGLLLSMMWKRMTRYKLKSFFMMLGIIVSVWATILLRTTGHNIRESFVSFIKYQYSSDTITVVSKGGFAGGFLTLEDIQTVVNSIGDITAYEPFLYSGFREIKNQGANLQTMVKSSSDKAPLTTNRHLQEGDFFSEEEMRSRARVALLGSKTALDLFGQKFPIGETFFIDNVAYEVKGVLEDAGFDPHGNDQDYAVLIPYTTLMNQLKVNYVSGVRFLVSDSSLLEETGKEITRILREEHYLEPDEDDDFNVLTAGKLLVKVAGGTFKILDTFLPIIISVAFLVAGIVILSIMMISVRERTPEIGLRKALGARPTDLKLQFLLEISLLSMLGAVIGVLLALPSARLISPFVEQKYGAAQLIPSLSIILSSVLVAVIVGAVAGYLPAARAARLNPVEAIQ